MSKQTGKQTGIEIIADERARQIAKEGYDAAHDDCHEQGEIAIAAACYALPEDSRTNYVWANQLIHLLWPWDMDFWKPAKRQNAKQRIRELAKAGALCAAEIDRLQRHIADTADSNRRLGLRRKA